MPEQIPDPDANFVAMALEDHGSTLGHTAARMFRDFEDLTRVTNPALVHNVIGRGIVGALTKPPLVGFVADTLQQRNLDLYEGYQARVKAICEKLGIPCPTDETEKDIPI